MATGAFSALILICLFLLTIAKGTMPNQTSIAGQSIFVKTFLFLDVN